MCPHVQQNETKIKKKKKEGGGGRREERPAPAPLGRLAMLFQRSNNDANAAAAEEGQINSAAAGGDHEEGDDSEISRRYRGISPSGAILAYAVLVSSVVLVVLVIGGSGSGRGVWALGIAIWSVLCILRVLQMPSLQRGRGHGSEARASGVQAPTGVVRVTRRQWERLMQRRHPHLTAMHLQLMMSDRDFNAEDYQALLDLDQNNVVPSTVGATEAEIRRNPCFIVADNDEKQKSRSCSICLYPFAAGDSVRTIPCLHQYHTDCIDGWLRTNAICPVCKFPAVG
jgi:hypothetical protein